MSTYENICSQLRDQPHTWLVTGAAGFIGSHLVETLLKLNQKVVGVDNFSTGKRENLFDIRQEVGLAYSQFQFIDGDITNQETCRRALERVDYVLHQAALGSVPRSFERPLDTNHHNVNGHLTMLNQVKLSGISRFVYASSSSVYGDHPELPKREQNIGKQLSPYAVSKYTNELYSQVFSNQMGVETVGLRYFNVFGKRQSPNGSYAAVIPLWLKALFTQSSVHINGDGETSRDFCYVANVVQANILAALFPMQDQKAFVFNVACGERTSLNSLFESMKNEVEKKLGTKISMRPSYREERNGDVRHSLADISQIMHYTGYDPTHRIFEGMKETVNSFTLTST